MEGFEPWELALALCGTGFLSYSFMEDKKAEKGQEKLRRLDRYLFVLLEAAVFSALTLVVVWAVTNNEMLGIVAHGVAGLICSVFFVCLCIMGNK